MALLVLWHWASRSRYSRSNAIVFQPWVLALRLLIPLLLFCIVFVAVGVNQALAEVYLNKEQALDLVLGPNVERVYDKQVLSPELQAELQKKGLAEVPGKFAHFFIGKQDAITTGYALIDNQVGKHLPITYIVGISPQGKVTRVEMMVFREIRGWEARERRFMKQFEEKDISKLRGDDFNLRSVSGATLSSRAIEKGVARALYLWQQFYGNVSP